MPTRSGAALALTLVLALVAAGCGGGDDDTADDAGGRDGTTTTTEAASGADATTTTEAAPSGGDEPTSTTVDPEGIADIESLAQGLLITRDELAIPNFDDVGYTPFSGPNECATDVDAEFPPDVLVGTALGDGTRVFQEEIRVYSSTTVAAVGFDARVNAFRCGTGNQGTTYAEPVDVNEQVGAEAAFAVAAANPEFEGVLITALVSDAVVSYVFVRPPGDPGTDLPDPLEVAAFGAGKIIGALEEG